MKKFLIFLSVSVFCSCKVVVTNIVSIKDYNPSALLKQDTLNASYYFWKYGGQVQFTITNKSAKPLYIDWKKCILFVNNTSYTYWEDKSFINSLLSYYGNSSNSTITKAERVMFIAPSSKYTFALGSLPMWNEGFKKDSSVLNYKYEETPLIIRNYLTFSFKESFEEEFYLDNYFWVSNITTTDFTRYCGELDIANYNRCTYPNRVPYTYFYDLKVKTSNKK